MSRQDGELPEEMMWAGNYITAKRRGKWEYAGRPHGIRAAAILAKDEDGRLILVAQYRVPLGRECLEIPAGLVGDGEGEEGEDATAAARRELEEETGYRAETMEVLGDFYSSPGMVSESFTLLRATGLTRIGPGGGTAGEDITVHHVDPAHLPQFVAAWRAKGNAVDVRIAMLMTAEFMKGTGHDG